MTDVDHLQSALNNVAARIDEVTASPKPNYSIDGVSYSWGDYYRMLVDSYATLRKDLIMAQGPYEVRSQGI